MDYRFALCLSVSAINQFSALFLFVLSDIHFIFGTLLYHTKIQIKFEFGIDALIFHGVMAHGLRKISRFLSFPHFFCSCFHIFIWCLHIKLQIKFEFAFDPLIFHGVMALGLSKISRILSFPHFFCSCFQIFISYLVHCFVILRYRSSSSLVLIHWFFTELWPLDIAVSDSYKSKSCFVVLKLFPTGLYSW